MFEFTFEFTFEFKLFYYFCQKSVDVFFFLVLNKIYFISYYCLKNGFYYSLFVFLKKIYLYNACFIKNVIFSVLNIIIIIFIIIIFILVFFFYLMKENILCYDSNFFKQFQILYDEYKWKFYYKFIRDSKLKKKQGILFFDLELKDRPVDFKFGFKNFFYKFMSSLINFFFSFSFDKKRYRIWKWATYGSKRLSLRYNRYQQNYKVSPEKGSYREKKLFYFYKNKYYHQSDILKMFLKPNLTFLDSLYIFIFYREEYATLLAKEQTKMELDNVKDKLKEKLKARLGARLYRKLSSRKDQRQAVVVRMKLNSKDSFKEILSKDEISLKTP